jgi:hypothetical protein
VSGLADVNIELSVPEGDSRGISGRSMTLDPDLQLGGFGIAADF